MRVMRLKPENMVRNLVDESPAFRSELLMLRLATLPALSALAGKFNEVVERVCSETYEQVTKAYLLGCYKPITGWVGGKGAFGGDEATMKQCRISLAPLKHARNECCGADLGEARRLVAWSFFEPNTGD